MNINPFMRQHGLRQRRIPKYPTILPRHTIDRQSFVVEEFIHTSDVPPNSKEGIVMTMSDRDRMTMLTFDTPFGDSGKEGGVGESWM